MRRLIGVLVGVMLANLIVFGWEWLLPLTPFGGTVDPARAAEPDYLAALPLGAQLWRAVGWVLGPLLGGFLAFGLGRSDWTGWIVAGVAGGIGVANTLSVAHPFWMVLWSVTAPLAGVTLGFGLYRRWRAARLHLRQ